MFNFGRIASCFLSAAFLASCSTSGSAPAFLGAPMARSTTTTPNIFSEFVNVHFHNTTGRTLVVRTYWSYPILPDWILAEEKCVDPRQDWSSQIGFTYPNGQVEVRALEFDHNFCSGKVALVARLHFLDIQFHNDQATIASEVTIKETGKDIYRYLCGRQTDPKVGEKRCNLLHLTHHPGAARREAEGGPLVEGRR